MENPEKDILKTNKAEKESQTENIYGKEKFLPENAKFFVDKMNNDFHLHFESLGYQREKAVKISSGIDPTVRFIGSGISVLKPYFLEKEVPDPGVYILQSCLRTRNANRLTDDNYQPDWGSYFSNMGAITPPNRVEEGSNETFNFIKDKLGINDDNILVRVSSNDKELMQICKDRLGADRLEIDGQGQDYYKHTIGEPGVSGRSCNIALRNPGKPGFSDIGNLIILEDEKGSLCLEISIGVSTTLKQLHNLDHVQDCTPVIGLENVDKKYRRKFEDAAMTSAVLYQEGLRPFGQHNRNRILKKYITALSYFREKCGFDLEHLHKIVSDFEKREFPGSQENISRTLVDYLEAYDNSQAQKLSK